MTLSIDPNWDEWETWNQKNGSVFQSKYFAEAVKHSGVGVELVIDKEGNTVTGGCFGFIPFPRGIKRYFSEYRVVNGPIVTDQKQIIPLLDFLEMRARSYSAMTLPIKFPFAHGAAIKNGYILSRNAPVYSFHIDLTKEEDLLWTELAQTTRTAIRKAQKNKIVVRHVTNPGELQTIYALYLARVKAKKNWVPYPYSFFEGLWKTMYPRHMTILVASFKETLIAETIFFMYNKRLYYFNNGSFPEFWHLRANALLVWEGMRWGKQQGCLLFDFYGTPDGKDKNDPNYGLYVFKSGFGGKLVEESTFATKYLASSRKKIWDKLIVPVALPLYKAWAGGGIDE